MFTTYPYPFDGKCKCIPESCARKWTMAVGFRLSGVGSCFYSCFLTITLLRVISEFHFLSFLWDTNFSSLQHHFTLHHDNWMLVFIWFFSSIQTISMNFTDGHTIGIFYESNCLLTITPLYWLYMFLKIV